MLIKKSIKNVGVILNSFARGGEGGNIWNKIKSSNYLFKEHSLVIKETIDISNLYDHDNDLILWIKKCLSNNIRYFVTAGGDGTIHLVVNALVKFREYKPILGAIGLGSSNDFHKPFMKMYNGIPIRLEFDDAFLNDLGEVEYSVENNIMKKEYLVINASIGFVAEANKLFNNNSKVNKFIKRKSTNLAIFLSIFQEILNFKTIKLLIKYENKSFNINNIINISITKNPHFAGNLKYDCLKNPNDGYFNAYIIDAKNKKFIKFKILKILYNFMKEIISKNSLLRKIKCKEIEIETEKKELLEIDGELKLFTKAKFKILSKGLLICP